MKQQNKGKKQINYTINEAIAIVRRVIPSERAIKQRTDTIKEAKKIRSNNFTRSNRDKSNIGKMHDWIAP